MVKKDKVKVMVFGTFDGLHKGHFDFFKQARSTTMNPFLVVSIARDKNVKKIKGKIPEFKEKERLAFVKEYKLVDKVILAGLNDHIPHILKEKPEIIALGYDQEAYVDERGSRRRVLSHTASESKSYQGNPYIENLKKDLENKGLKVKIVRLKPYKENIYKNHLLKKRNLL